MSHIVQIETEIRDIAALRAGCSRLNLAAPEYGTARLFSGAKTGWQVRLPDWRYPVVIDTNTGGLEYDNFDGRWGDPQHLGRLLQSYAVEKAKLEARLKGHTATEQQLADGSIKVTIHTGSGHENN